jgi:hypothetical protein
MPLDPTFWDEPEPEPRVFIVNDYDQMELRLAAQVAKQAEVEKALRDYSEQDAKSTQAIIEQFAKVDTGRRRLNMMDIGKSLFPIQKMPEPSGASLYYLKDDDAP